MENEHKPRNKPAGPHTRSDFSRADSLGEKSNSRSERGKLRPAKARLVVALDFPTAGQALALVDLLTPEVRFFKVGLELFVASGPPVVGQIREKGAEVFLDLKLHDIPNTVQRAASCAARLGAGIISIHLSVGREGLRAAAEGVREVVQETGKESILAGVTVLTSLGHDGVAGERGSILEQVLHLSRLAQECGIDGIITSVMEAGEVRRSLGKDSVIITPGIRLSRETDDHKRTGTVKDALTAGSDYLVVGRPITRASDPLGAAKRFLDEMATLDAVD